MRKKFLLTATYDEVYYQDGRITPFIEAYQEVLKNYEVQKEENDCYIFLTMDELISFTKKLYEHDDRVHEIIIGMERKYHYPEKIHTITGRMVIEIYNGYRE